MAIGGGPDPLERATQALRDEPEPQPDWPQVSNRIKGRVRSLVRPAPALLTVGADGDPSRDEVGSRTWVSGRVLVSMVRERIRQEGAVPRDVDLDVVDDRCRSVRVDLVCSYGTDLVALGEQVRADVHELLLDLLGPDPERDDVEAVQVSVVDVVVGDARVD
jgi:uncharacterized alkaline shock family protein YloU